MALFGSYKITELPNQEGSAMTRCPYCGGGISTSHGLAPGSTPDVGDLTACSFCLGWLIFDGNMELRKLWPIEQEQVLHDPRCTHLMRSMKITHALYDRQRQQ